MDTVPHRLQSSRTPLDAVPPPPLASSVSDSPASTVPGGADRVVAALLAARAQGRRDDWVAVVGECQALMNALAALQDVALAEVARRESDWCEDGTLGERVHEPGRVTLDAADLAAPVLGASHAQAQRRVEQAVRLAAARLPVEADGRDVPEPSGLAGLHEAMAAGHLDAYRAGVVAEELELAPAAVAETVVSALSRHLSCDAPTLRRRTRQLVGRISPDLLRRRATKARASTGLRRWVAEPGVDEWHGTFPSEEAALAWAAIDGLAHELVAQGTCSSVEQARGKALTDLVTGHATIGVQVVLTVPAGTAGGHHSAGGRDTVQCDDDLVQVQGARPSEPLLVSRGWLRDHLPKAPRDLLRRAAPGSGSSTRRTDPVFAPCDPLTGARLDAGGRLGTDAYRPGVQLVALVRARDGRCRFPGCSVAARFCDLDHVRPWPTGPTADHNLLCLCRRHHRVKQRPGWRAHLAPDRIATWTDPTGRVRTTAPLDALASLVLASDPADRAGRTDRPRADGASRLVRSGTRPPPSAPDAFVVIGRQAMWSALETHLGLRMEHHGQHAGHPHVYVDHPRHGYCTSAAGLREGLARRRARAAVCDIPPF